MQIPPHPMLTCIYILYKSNHTRHNAPAIGKDKICIDLHKGDSNVFIG